MTKTQRRKMKSSILFFYSLFYCIFNFSICCFVFFNTFFVLFSSVSLSFHLYAYHILSTHNIDHRHACSKALRKKLTKLVDSAFFSFFIFLNINIIVECLFPNAVWTHMIYSFGELFRSNKNTTNKRGHRVPCQS